MKKAQRDKAIAVIAEGAKACGYYVVSEGDTCAVGSLALAAGIALPSPHAWENKLPIQSAALRDMASRLVEAYGLSLRELAVIQSLNDLYWWDVDVRRRYIIEYLEMLPVEEDNKDRENKDTDNKDTDSKDMEDRHE